MRQAGRLRPTGLLPPIRPCVGISCAEKQPRKPSALRTHHHIPSSHPPTFAIQIAQSIPPCCKLQWPKIGSPPHQIRMISSKKQQKSFCFTLHGCRLYWLSGAQGSIFVHLRYKNLPGETAFSEAAIAFGIAILDAARVATTLTFTGRSARLFLRWLVAVFLRS